MLMFTIRAQTAWRVQAAHATQHLAGTPESTLGDCPSVGILTARATPVIAISPIACLALIMRALPV